MIDVTCIGNALVDLTINVQDAVIQGSGLKKGIMKLNDDVAQKELLSSLSAMKPKMSTGGSAANVALGVALLNGKSCFSGKSGVDNNGFFLEDNLKKAKVITRITKTPDFATGTAITLITPDAERTFSTHLGASSTLTEEDLKDIPPSKFLHIEAYLLEDPIIREIIIKTVKKAKEKGTKISFDLSDPELIKRIKPIIQEFVELTDVIFANEKEAKVYVEKEGLDAARELNKTCEIAIVKQGEKGSIISTKTEEKIIRPEIVKPINTNGAGDAYAAGFLYGLSQKYSLQKTAEIASFLAKETVLVEESIPQEINTKNTNIFK